MKIHGLVYVVLGVLMALYARFIGSQVDSGAMVLFFWVGVGFLVFGVFRLILGYVFKDKEKVSRRESPALNNLKKQKEDFMRKQTINSSGEIVSCGRCGTRHYKNSNFCHMCGYSLK